jgi:hypothetical protein
MLEAALAEAVAFRADAERTIHGLQARLEAAEKIKAAPPAEIDVILPAPDVVKSKPAARAKISVPKLKAAAKPVIRPGKPVKWWVK